MKNNLLKRTLVLLLSVVAGVTVYAQRSASANWPLTAAETTNATIKGQLEGADLVLSGVQIGAYTALDGTAYFGPTATNWPGVSEDANVYIQFSVTAVASDTLYLQEVSAYVCGKGGSNMRANFYYSTDATFATKTQIQYKVGEDLTRDNVAGYDKMTETVSDLEIPNGDTIYFRIYPYYKSAGATGKFLCVKDVTLGGYTPGEPIYSIPTLAATTAATYVSTTSAISTGEITSNGDATVTEYGFVYGTSSNPTVDVDSKFIVDSILDDVFTDTITGLTAGTTYFVRAYATNSQGTGYGDEITFTTLAALSAPTVVTGSASGITNNGFAVTNCQVTAWGGTEVTERGIVYGTSPNPTISDGKSVRGSDIGTFVGYAGNLNSETTYYARAFATNSVGTSYGSEVSVTTLATQPDVEKLVAKDGSGDYTTISDAFAAVPSNYMGRYIIRVKPGVYRERPTLAAGKINVYLVGYCDGSVDYTIIEDSVAAGMDNGSGGIWGTSNSQVMAILADDFTAAYITVRNLYVNAKSDPLTSKQAVALKTQGDRQSFYHCKIEGYQDTYLGNSIGRAYFKDCYIEGNVDFIFGKQTCVFDSCTTYVNRNGSVLTAPATEKTSAYGMVFLDCKLTAPEVGYVDFDGESFGSATGKGFYFGRPWQGQPKSAFIRCDAPATLELKGWTTMNFNLNPVFVEYGTIGDGGTDLSQRGNEGVVISETEAAQFTVSNIFKAATDPSLYYDWMPASDIADGLVYECSLTDVLESVSTVTYKTILASNIVTNELKLENSDFYSKYDIVNVMGQKVMSSEVYESYINVSNLPTGTYFIRACSKMNECSVEKFIKK